MNYEKLAQRLYETQGDFVPWEMTVEDTRQMWRFVARAAHRIVYEEDEDGNYIDAVLTESAVTPNNDNFGAGANLRLVVPDVVRFHAKPEAGHRKLSALLAQASSSDHMLRLRVMSRSAIESEHQRIDRDGQVRPLAPLEGTW